MEYQVRKIISSLSIIIFFNSRIVQLHNEIVIPACLNITTSVVVTWLIIKPVGKKWIPVPSENILQLSPQASRQFSRGVKFEIRHSIRRRKPIRQHGWNSSRRSCFPRFTQQVATLTDDEELRSIRKNQPVPNYRGQWTESVVRSFSSRATRVRVRSPWPSLLVQGYDTVDFDSWITLTIEVCECATHVSIIIWVSRVK